MRRVTANQPVALQFLSVFIDRKESDIDSRQQTDPPTYVVRLRVMSLP